MTNDEIRGALIGCGFFAHNHMHAWQEVEGARISAVCDLDISKAWAVAKAFGIQKVYSDVPEMLEKERPDFVDIVTQPDSHAALVKLAARFGVHVICQKPLASTLEEAKEMVDVCREAGVRFMVHENFRWQTPMRAVREAAAAIGPPFYGQISFRSAFDVFATQPYLATDERFILYDLGIHQLDLARFFLGDVETLYARIIRVNPDIRGEDVATVVLTHQTGAICVVDMSYASRLERELFPQTLVHLEGPDGSVSLRADYHLTVVSPNGIEHRQVAPRHYPWSAEPAVPIQESMVEIQRHWVDVLRDGGDLATPGADNIRSLELVFAAYDSAYSGTPVSILLPHADD